MIDLILFLNSSAIEAIANRPCGLFAPAPLAKGSCFIVARALGSNQVSTFFRTSLLLAEV